MCLWSLTVSTRYDINMTSAEPAFTAEYPFGELEGKSFDFKL